MDTQKKLFMIFGYQNTGGGGPQLWKLNGGAPNTISLQTPTVNGIDAVNPVDANLFLVLDSSLVPNGNAYKNPPMFGLAGVTNQGQYVALLAMVNIATQENASVNVQDNFLNSIEAQDVNTQSKRQSDKISITDFVEDRNNNTRVEKNQSQSDYAIRVLPLGVETARVEIDTTGFIVGDGVTQNLRIEPTGIIQTGASVAGAPGLPAGIRLPIKNMAGVVLGYIDLTL